MTRTKQRLVHRRIREFRRRLELTQAQLGDRIGTDKGTVSHWENGDYAPGGKSLPKLAYALGVSIDDLYGDAA